MKNLIILLSIFALYGCAQDSRPKYNPQSDRVINKNGIKTAQRFETDGWADLFPLPQ